MLGILIKKEIATRIRDLRFIALLAVFGILGPASILTGVEHYRIQLQEHDKASAFRRDQLDAYLADGDLDGIGVRGYTWNRPPEKLLPFVTGLSGALGREAALQEWTMAQKRSPLHFEISPFELNPAHRLFGTLDIAFLAEIVLSIGAFVLLFDIICGEKEAGTLRLVASFPVPRRTLALAKLIAGSLTVWLPLMLLFALAALTASVSGLGLSATEGWLLVAILVLFLLYLTVFVSFGLWASALAHRRATSFLILLSLWAIWVYLVPSVILRTAVEVHPIADFYELEGRSQNLRWRIAGELVAEHGDKWNGWMKRQRLSSERFYSRIRPLVNERDNKLSRRSSLLSKLSFLSPLTNAHLTAMDLAGTGWRKQHEIEKALRDYRKYFVDYIWKSEAKRNWEPRTSSWVDDDGNPYKLVPLARFTFDERRTVNERIAENAAGFLWLALLSVLGFVGAFITIVRYDVR